MSQPAPVTVAETRKALQELLDAILHARATEGGAAWFTLQEAINHGRAVLERKPEPVVDLFQLRHAFPLSKVQSKALADFVSPGGHGYGEGAYLSRATAKALEARGLVVLSGRSMLGGWVISWGRATELGELVAKAIRVSLC